MKNFKKLMIVGLCIAALGFTSCKKNYTCTCTIDYEDNTYVQDYTVPIDLGKQTKSDAELLCNGYISDYEDEFVTVNCDLD